MMLSELYTSIQCEGPNTGKPMQFVRFGGCNMRCPGWPCDTEYAIDPKHNASWERIEPNELIKRIPGYPRHVCLTGGEPLLQKKADMESFIDQLLALNFKIDLFTNGSQPFPAALRQADLVRTIVLDWKLPGSGEQYSGIVQRRENLIALSRFDAVKFVVKDYVDLDAASRVWKEYSGTHAQWYVGRVWGTQLSDADIVQFILDYALPWNLNVQLHKMIWPEATRGV